MPNNSEMCVLRIKKDVRDKLNEYRIRKIVDWKRDVSMEEALDDLLTVELEYEDVENNDESAQQGEDEDEIEDSEDDEEEKTQNEEDDEDSDDE